MPTIVEHPDPDIISKKVERRFIGALDGTFVPEKCNFELRTELRGSRKRARVDEDDDNDERGAGGDTYDPALYLRDPDFYAGGDGVGPGEIVVRVQDTLFKIPRSVLEQAKELKLPSKRHDATNPWELAWTFKTRDTLTTEPKDLFRDLLWLLKAQDTPSLSPQEDTEANRIFQLGGFVRDLGLTQLTIWIQDLAAKASETSSFLDACSSELLVKLFDIAHEARDSGTKTRLARRWARRVWQPAGGGGGLPAVPAILFAEQYSQSRNRMINPGSVSAPTSPHRPISSNRKAPEEEEAEALRELLGVAYYMHLVFNVPDLHVPLDDGMATAFRAHPKLGQAQTLKLLRGHYSLTQFWIEFRKTPLKLPSASIGACEPDHHKKCISSWASRWNEAKGWKRIMALPAADALGLIACLRDQLANDDRLKKEMSPGCRQAGLDLLWKTYEEFKMNLASHFTSSA